ncbi:hypothetical protein [Cryptosporangium aurantiacum]|uniref:DUF4333 domain-containing protein n=1 Tax=Cryptosporangium aurantiacum TaxID=134849 RepID=A0A1M7JN80_9ACTN|nr:hypothetical protein [Cryptosporangium aurantiacum]SHM54365.1 hypothetical protein SAMN05443668_101855 [Cryptosporangium aurantiacum]
MSPARHAIEQNRRHRAWMLAAAVAVVVVVIGALGAVVTLRSGGDPDVAAAANRFRPLAGWWQVENEDRSGAGCVDTGCPLSFRRWQADAAPSPSDLRRSLESAGWSEPKITGTCRPVEGRSGTFPLCTVQASGDGMQLTLTVTEVDSYQILLTVESA